MPITGPASYLPTIDLFLKHWEQVDNSLNGSGPVVISGGLARAGLAAKRDALDAGRDVVTDATVERALARSQLTARVTALQARMVEFNARVRADLPGSAYAEALPAAFSVGDAEGSVRDGLRQVLKLWTKVNAIAPAPAGLTLPLLLQGGCALAQFDADRTALRDAYRALSDAEVELNLARGERNVLQDAIYEVLKSYRLKVPTVVPARSPLLETLPALTPLPGRTPTAVKVRAAWDAPSAKARVTWDASADTDLKHYEVRAVAGDSYATDDEVTLATIPANGARELLNDFALEHPGLTVGYKVYVVLTTGNEKGSEPLYVTRPV